MFRKRNEDAIELAFREKDNVKRALEEEGKTGGECGYFEFMALTLIDLEFTLRRIRFMLAILIGLVIGKFLAKLF